LIVLKLNSTQQRRLEAVAALVKVSKEETPDEHVNIRNNCIFTKVQTLLQSSQFGSSIKFFEVWQTLGRINDHV